MKDSIQHRLITFLVALGLVIGLAVTAQAHLSGPRFPSPGIAALRERVAARRASRWSGAPNGRRPGYESARAATAPVVAPVVPAAAPPSFGGSVRDRVLAAWPGDDAWIARVVGCESGFNPRAVGGGGNNYFGLLQMGPWARAHYGNPLNQTIEQQIAAGWRLFNDAGPSQWECK